MKKQKIRLFREGELKYILDKDMPYVEYAFCKTGLDLAGFGEGDWIRISLEKIEKPKWINRQKEWVESLIVG